MSIERIPEHVVSRIAAGEVVERPANIVKELVENAIDAEASKIIIQIENGGLDSVHVQDNGTGIPKEKLAFAFELHTSSKVKDENIHKIATLGFRGEALGSISAVSHITCRSKTDDQGSGYQVQIEGGKVIEQAKAISIANGTSIRVSGIFFNTPARRKFLKKASTERKWINNLVTNYCLIFPEIHFVLEEKDNAGKFKKKIESPPRKSQLAAVFDVLGSNIAGNLLPINGNTDIWDISGFISEPILIRKDRTLQYINVNNRPVSHQDLQKIVEKSYGEQLMKSSHPVIILNIKGPVEEVDYNIHPQKSEIRFKTEDNIMDYIANLVKKSLDDTWEIPSLPAKKLERIKPTQVDTSEQRETTPDLPSEPLVDVSIEPEAPKTEGTLKYIQTQLDFDNLGEVIMEEKEVEVKEDDRVKRREMHVKESLKSQEQLVFEGKKILGQIMQKFAIIDAGKELWLMDIHAADERVKFEKYEDQRRRKILAQQFLYPMEINLTATEKDSILDNAEILEKYGLKVSDGGGTVVLLHSCPVFYDYELNKESATELLMEMHAILDGEEAEIVIETPFSKREYTIVARLACHGAIRSGTQVSNQVVMNVLQDLLKTRNPWSCAHGRPTILRMSRNQLEGWFKR